MKTKTNSLIGQKLLHAGYREITLQNIFTMLKCKEIEEMEQDNIISNTKERAISDIKDLYKDSKHAENLKEGKI